MPFHDYWTPQPYDYDRATRGLAETLQRYMDMADGQEDEAVAEGILATALQIYEWWYQFSTTPVCCGPMTTRSAGRY